MLSFFPRGVLDELLNLIESVSEDFPSYFFLYYVTLDGGTDIFVNYVYCVSTPI